MDYCFSNLVATLSNILGCIYLKLYLKELFVVVDQAFSVAALIFGTLSLCL